MEFLHWQCWIGAVVRKRLGCGTTTSGKDKSETIEVNEGSTSKDRPSFRKVQCISQALVYHMCGTGTSLAAPIPV
jgi:hypothetical protein